MDTLQLKRLIAVRRPYYTPKEGELLYEIDTHKLYVGDGVQAGGNFICLINFNDLVDVPPTSSGMFFRRSQDNTSYEWAPAASTFTELADSPIEYPSINSYVNVTIAPNLIEEDLSDSVIKLDISESCGLNSANLSDFFDVLNTSVVVNDTFIGTDGDLPDPLLWRVSDTAAAGNSVGLSGNKLRFGFVTGTADTQSVSSKYYISGDFDVQVNWTQSVNTTVNRLNLGIRLYDDSGHYVDIRKHNYSTNRQYVLYKEDGWFEYTYVSSTTDNFRIVRSGTTFSYYYGSPCSNLVATGVHSTIGQNVRILLWAAVESSYPSVNVDFDNFVLNSGTLIWFDSHPNRKKFQISTVDNTQCYTEIEKCDFANRQVLLHTRVPLISSSVDTRLKLTYSTEIDIDNPYVSDTVTVSGTSDLVAYKVNSPLDFTYLGLNGTGDGIEFKSLDSSKFKFIDLDDTPKSYTSGNYLRTTASGVQSIDGIILTAEDYSEWRIKVTTSGVLYTEVI